VNADLRAEFNRMVPHRFAHAVKHLQITPIAVFEVFDSVSKTMGNHTIKFGTQIRISRLNEWLRPQQTYYFGSFSDLENDNPFVLAKLGFPGFVGLRNSNWDFYAQDDWKVTRRLTF